MPHLFLNALLMIVLGTTFVGCAGDVVGTNSSNTTSDAQSADAMVGDMGAGGEAVSAVLAVKPVPEVWAVPRAKAAWPALGAKVAVMPMISMH